MPMEQEELERCLRVIYADRMPGNPYRWLAEDLYLDFEQVISWGGTLMPVPAEVACGLRVRAANMKGELPDSQETVLSLMNAKLVIRWIGERASRNELARVFSELGRLFHDRQRENQA